MGGGISSGKSQSNGGWLEGSKHQNQISQINFKAS